MGLARFWSVEGQSIRKAEVSDNQLVLELSGGKTLVVSAAGYLYVEYQEEREAA